MPSAAFTRARAISLAAVSVALVSLAGVAAQSNQPPEEFRAFAVNMSGVGATGTEMVEIDIKRWSSEKERKSLIATLTKGGQDNLVDALRDTPSVGTIRTPDSLAYDLRYATQTPGEDGGRRIVFMTDRPISFWEAVNRPRTLDYPLTVIEIRMPAEGPGEGKLTIATRISESGGTIVLENYGTLPVQLREVRAMPRR